MITDITISILTLLPILGLSSLGGLITHKSGVYNIAMEGIMVFGALAATFTYFHIFSSPWIALFGGLLGGILFGAILAVLEVRLKLNQIVVGFGLWFVAEGLAGTIYFTSVPSFTIENTFSSTLFSLNPIFYLTIGLAVVLYILFKRTKQGLAIRVVGENPKVADSTGINVFRVRWICCLVGSALVGASGAYASIQFLQGFTYSMIAGYGWIAFATILFGRFSSEGVFGASLFFTALIAIQTRLQVAGMVFIPTQFMVVIPHLAVIAALALMGIMGKSSNMPSGLGIPYERK